MKKLLLVFAALCLFTHFSLAQSGLVPNSKNGSTKIKKFYLRTGLGYAFPHAGQLTVNGIGVKGSIQSNINTNGNFSSTDYSLKKVSFGSGVQAVLAIGYEVHPNVSIELGVGSILASRRCEIEETDLYSSTGNVLIYHTKMHLKPTVGLLPAVVLRTGGSKLNLYSRLGLALPLINKIRIDEEGQNSDHSQWYAVTSELKSKFHIGFLGALGVKFKVTNRLGLWFEANGISMNAYAKKLTIKSYTQNGQNVISQVPSTQLEINYDFNATESNPPPGNASRALTFSIPYSNIGFEAGIHILL